MSNLEMLIAIWNDTEDYVEDFDDNVYTHEFIHTDNTYTIKLTFTDMKVTDMNTEVKGVELLYEKQHSVEEFILINGDGFNVINWYFNELKKRYNKRHGIIPERIIGIPLLASYHPNLYDDDEDLIGELNRLKIKLGIR